VGSGRQDHYDVLGVTRDAPDEVIRAAYRALAAKYHPDRNPGDSDAESKLKRLNAAFQVLSDPVKRKQHDDLTRSAEVRDERPRATPKTQPPLGRAPEQAARLGFAKRSAFWVTMAILSAVVMADGPRLIGAVCLLVSVLGLMGSREAR
jgi:curved DNA-binding protein CbpA